MGNFAVSLKQSINQLVSTDSLTGLYNRRSCETILTKIIEENKKYKTKSVIVIGDIDLFKQVNDTYGHQIGDLVLKELAIVFKEHMEYKGIVARWGGEEFMFIYERMDMERVYEHLQELMKAIENMQIPYNDEMISVGMTFGAALCDQDCDIDQIIKLADDNLYYGKNHGRHMIVIK